MYYTTYSTTTVSCATQCISILIQTPTSPPTNASLLPTIAVPSLNDPTFNIIVLRARSRLERDLWVRAIGYERERIVREEQRWGSQREARVREMGRCDWKG